MYLKTKKKIYTGIKDINGSKIYNGDCVKMILKHIDNVNIYGKIVYDCQSIHTTEYYQIEQYSTGFLIQYSDKSGYTGLDYDWVKVTPDEYNKHLKECKSWKIKQ